MSIVLHIVSSAIQTLLLVVRVVNYVLVSDKGLMTYATLEATSLRPPILKQILIPTYLAMCLVNILL